MGENQNDLKGQETNLLDSEESLEAPSIPRSVWVKVALCLVLVLGYPLIGWLMGLNQFANGPRAFVSSPALRLVGGFLFFWLALQIIVVIPIVHFVYPAIQKNKLTLVRVGALFLFISPPLLSYVFYLSGANEGFEIRDLLVTVLPATWLSAYFFEKTQKSLVFSLFLAATLYWPIFVLGDVMGAYFTLWNYYPRSPHFESLRLAALALAIAIAVLATNKKKPLRIWL